MVAAREEHCHLEAIYNMFGLSLKRNILDKLWLNVRLFICTACSGGSKGAPPGTPRPKFFHFYAAFGKNFGELAPRHWFIYDVNQNTSEENQHQVPFLSLSSVNLVLRDCALQIKISVSTSCLANS